MTRETSITVRTTGSNDIFDSVQRLFEDVLIEQQNRGERLVLCGRRDMVLDSQAAQKSVYIAFDELTRMLMEFDVPANPVNAGFFGAAAVMSNAKCFDQRVV